MKKLISYIVCTCLITGVFPIVDNNKAKAESVLSNPIINEEGLATWDCIYFGSYPQSDPTGAVNDPIKWRVLSISEGEALLIADTNLDVQRYNDSFEEVTWETSTLRGWLNDYFFNKAFSEEEQQYILNTSTRNSYINKYEISGGKDTVDKVFVLSADEVMNENYGFVARASEDSGRIRRNTAYIAAGGYLTGEGANVYGEGSPDAWWLRTPGDTAYKTATVMYKGEMSEEGDIVNLKNTVVCPSIRIDISNVLWTYAGTVNTNEETDDGVEETTIEETTIESATTKKVGSEQITPEEKSTGLKTTTVSNESTSVLNDIASTTTQQKKPAPKKIKVAKSKIKKAAKKKAAKSVKISFKKIKSASKYQVSFSTTKKFRKTLVSKNVKKASIAISNKKLKNKKKLYVRVRAIVIKGKEKYYGKWSGVKKVKVN